MDTVFGVGVTTFDERTTDNGHRVVSLSNDEHSNKLFVTVDNVVTAKLFRFLLMPYEFLRGCFLQVTSVGLVDVSRFRQPQLSTHP